MNVSDFRFVFPIRVRYSEIDGQKIVFNSHYMTYLDITMVEYFRELLGEDWLSLSEQHMFDIALVKMTLEFKQPARLDDVLDVYCGVKKLGNSSFTVSFMITRNGQEEVLTAEAVYVNYHAKEAKAQPIPTEIRQKIIDFEGLD